MNPRNEEGALAGAFPVQHFAQRHSSRSPLEKARDVLRDAIVASGVDEFSRMAILAAADALARERMRAEFADFVAELNTERGKAA